MIKTQIERFRPWCYAILHSGNQAILVEKMRWPFTGLYDLPGWWIDHGEDSVSAVIRELREEIWLEAKATDLEIMDVFTHVVEYENREGGIISQHMLGIVYSVHLDDDTFSSIANWEILGIEVDWDAGKRIVLNLWDIDSIGLTPICHNALKNFLKLKI